MRRIILGLLTASSALAFASAASAADLPARVYKAPPAPIFSWTGAYIGVNVGASWGTKEWDQFVNIPTIVSLESDSSHSVNGALAGGQIGYNYQAGWTVWGVEIQADWADIKGKGNCGLAALWNCTSKIDGLATFAGKFGVAFDHSLVYVKGGAAWAHDKYDLNLLGLTFPGLVQPSSLSDSRWGWMMGAGVEVATAGNWSAKVEYDYMDFGSKNYLFNTVPATGLVGLPGLLDNFTVTQRVHLVKFGLNYRFGYNSVVAAY